MNNLGPAVARRDTLSVIGSFPTVGTSQENAVQGYVPARLTLTTLMRRPGMVLIEVVAANAIASSIFAHLAPNTFIFLPVQRTFFLAFNLVLAAAFLLLLAVHRHIGKRVASVQRTTQAGFAMALLAGPLLYLSVGRWAPGMILLLVIALVGSIQSMRNARRQRSRSFRLPTLPALASPAKV
ncbi:MAG TPA: hypothetical protein VN837_22000 [Chloroflexota bacterium]|nr:hypothetical protein [Chloroflexota bacterium]